MVKKLDAETKIDEAGYVWSMNYNLGDGKVLQVTGNFAKSASKQEMSVELDKMTAVMKRQRIIQLELPTMTESLRAQARQADDLTNQLEDMIERKGQNKWNVQEKSVAENLRENIRKLREEMLPAGKEALAELMDQLKEMETE